VCASWAGTGYLDIVSDGRAGHQRVVRHQRGQLVGQPRAQAARLPIGGGGQTGGGGLSEGYDLAGRTGQARAQKRDHLPHALGLVFLLAGGRR
jgi:hypothetical protein